MVISANIVFSEQSSGWKIMWGLSLFLFFLSSFVLWDIFGSSFKDSNLYIPFDAAAVDSFWNLLVVGWPWCFLLVPSSILIDFIIIIFNITLLLVDMHLLPLSYKSSPYHPLWMDRTILSYDLEIKIEFHMKFWAFIFLCFDPIPEDIPCMYWTLSQIYCRLWAWLPAM